MTKPYVIRNPADQIGHLEYDRQNNSIKGIESKNERSKHRKNHNVLKPDKEKDNGRKE